MPRLTRRVIFPVAAAGVLLSLAGCSKQLNTDKLEPQIEKAFTQSGAAVESVDCPGDVSAKKGDKFECTVTTKGGKKGKVEVTQTDDNGHVVFRPMDVKLGK